MVQGNRIEQGSRGSEYLLGHDWFEVTQLSSEITAIREPYHFEDVFCYVVELPSGLLMIDSGMGLANVRHVIPVDKPVTVLLTHSDWDHVGGIREFSDVRIYNDPQEVARIISGWSPNDIGEFTEKDFTRLAPTANQLSQFHIPGYTSAQTFEDLAEMEVFGLRIQVIHTPGHTSGSSCFFVPETGDLFTGDTLYPGPEYLHIPGADPQQYLESLIKLQGRVGHLVKRILPGHNASAAEPELLTDHILALKGELEPIEIVHGEDQFGLYTEKKFRNFALRLPRAG